MEKEVYLVIGLGNPGSTYAHTRHNAGFEVTDILARRWHADISRKKCSSLIAETTYAGHRVVLAQPQTFMNLSGQAVAELLNWYKCPLDHMLVIYDDIDLPASHLRVRLSGSAGTHNGMRSIIQHTPSTAFPRIRVGVGSKPEGWDLADWVLSRYQPKALQEDMQKAFQRAGECVEDWLENGIQHAMQIYNKNDQSNG